MELVLDSGADRSSTSPKLDAFKNGVATRIRGECSEVGLSLGGRFLVESDDLPQV